MSIVFKIYIHVSIPSNGRPDKETTVCPAERLLFYLKRRGTHSSDLALKAFWHSGSPQSKGVRIQ